MAESTYIELVKHTRNTTIMMILMIGLAWFCWFTNFWYPYPIVFVIMLWIIIRLFKSVVLRDVKGNTMGKK